MTFLVICETGKNGKRIQNSRNLILHKCGLNISEKRFTLVNVKDGFNFLG